MLRRATDDDHYGLAFLQHEASRPTPVRIIIIIQCGDAQAKHDDYQAPDFQHYTREYVSREGKVV